MKKIQDLLQKYRHEVIYIIFGVLTTAVNYAVYLLCTRLFAMDAAVATAIAWVAAVLFSYVTNRRMVFESQASTAGEVLQELVKFVTGRVFTGLLDIAVMYVTVDLLGWNDLIMKIASNVVIVVLNYVISKVLVFKNRKS